MRHTKYKNTGFTLLELLLVVAMMSIVATFSITLGSGFIWRTDLSQAQYLTVVNLRHAQVLAQAQAQDSDWGVHIENNQLTVFKGNDFAVRDTESDEEYDLGSVTVGSAVDVLYHKFSGEPYAAPYQIDLTAINETASISIDSEGTVTY